MSVVRRASDRAKTRKLHSSPYARPQDSGWSWRNLLDPIRRRVFGEPEESQDLLPRYDQFTTPSPEPEPAHEVNAYTQSQETIDSHASEPPLSRSATLSPKRPAPSAGPSARATLDNVIDFLTEAAGTILKREEIQRLTALIRSAIPEERIICQSLPQSGGKPLSAIEVEGIISLLKKSPIYRKVEPFRFQSAPPSRSESPSASTSTQAPTKMLKKNPNGPIRWNGGGSSKQRPRGNRYGSPAFGTRHIAPEKPAANGDGKRRKVDDHVPGSSMLSVQQPSPPTPKSNGVSAPKTTPARLRTNSIAKPTTPAQPSPLRQTWSGSPSSSQEDISVTTSPSKSQPSETANFMSELVSKVTPPARPDVSNPYQTASPLAKIMPPAPVRRSARRSRAPATKSEATTNGAESGTGSQASLTEEQMKVLPSQSFVEATLPKGSKRSRPATRSQKSPSPEPVKSNIWKAPDTTSDDIDELDEDQDEEDRTGKKAKASPFGAPASSSSKDVAMTNGTSSDKAPSSSLFGNGTSTSGPPSFSSMIPKTAPARPSKLRYSYQPDGSAPSSPTSDNVDSEMSAPPPPTFKSAFSNLPPVPVPSSSAGSTSKPATLFFTSTPSVVPPPKSMEVEAPAVPEKVDPKTQALNMPISELPTYVFTITVSMDTGFSKERNMARLKSSNTLPTFDFPRPAEKPAVKAFDWAAATGKPLASTSTASGKWRCNVCDLESPESFKEKCSVCEAPRPSAGGPAPKAPISAPAEAPKAFNWSSAGMKPPSASGWKCSGCLLDRPDSDADKCGICEAPRPGAAPKPAAVGFDWSAAGMKAPTASGAQWSCGTCGLKNPSSATTCTICEAPRS